MMKHVFFLLAIASTSFAPSTVFAQKCKYVTDETDPMTDERVRRCKMTMDGRDFVVNYYRKGDEYRVEMQVALIGERNFVVVEGTELSLKLGNGEIEMFRAVQKATPVSYIAGTQVATNYSATFGCTEAQMARLAAHGFKVASIQLGDETITRVLDKEKKQVATQSNAACILGD
jgi:hypothetical protein